jgi:hypothetical protein
MMAGQQDPIKSSSTLYAGGTAGFDQPGGLGLHEADKRFLNAVVQAKGVEKPVKLREITVMCMIFNRMIGQ